MNRAIEVITVDATAPGASSAFAALAGNSLTIRDSAAAKLIGLWGLRQTAGHVQITSPLLHDAVVGLQSRQNLGVTESKIVAPQKLTPQDTLVVSGSGSNTAGDVELSSLLVMYEDLAGIDANLIDADELRLRAEDLYTSTNDITSTGAGGYTGQELITVQQDQLKANRDYAIIGASISFGNDSIATIRYISPDWGNLGIGLPAIESRVRDSSSWFYELSLQTGMATIPVFNASQKSSIFIDVAGNEDAGAQEPEIMTHMVLLKNAPRKTVKRRKK